MSNRPLTKIEKQLSALSLETDAAFIDLVDRVHSRAFNYGSGAKFSKIISIENVKYLLFVFNYKIAKMIRKVFRYIHVDSNRHTLDVEDLLNTDPISFTKKVYVGVYGKKMPDAIEKNVKQSMFYREYHPQVFLLRHLLSEENLDRKEGAVKLSSTYRYIVGWIYKKMFNK